MPRVRCCETVSDFEEWASRELREVLEVDGWEDASQYRVQVLFNAVEPVCPTPQQRQRVRAAVEAIAREMGFPLELTGREAAGAAGLSGGGAGEEQ
ncbi:hypothetical protein ACFV42_23810 [Streptomyces solisilvae]|uniref:hypothetical protein n=1 Tax=Streptomyces malaysiensis TaxID=92644 RepID=UPI003693C4F9